MDRTCRWMTFPVSLYPVELGGALEARELHPGFHAVEHGDKAEPCDGAEGDGGDDGHFKISLCVSSVGVVCCVVVVG